MIGARPCLPEREIYSWRQPATTLDGRLGVQGGHEERAGIPEYSPPSRRVSLGRLALVAWAALLSQACMPGAEEEANAVTAHEPTFASVGGSWVGAARAGAEHQALVLEVLTLMRRNSGWALDYRLNRGGRREDGVATLGWDSRRDCYRFCMQDGDCGCMQIAGGEPTISSWLEVEQRPAWHLRRVVQLPGEASWRRAGVAQGDRP